MHISRWSCFYVLLSSITRLSRKILLYSKLTSTQKDQISKSEDSALDIEEELKRVLDFQEKERVEMQNKVKNFANQLQVDKSTRRVTE